MNAGYRSYANETGFVINPSRRKSPQDKGKVERRVRDVKYIQITERDHFNSVEELQSVTDERLLDRSLKLTSPVTGRSVYESWYEELPTLRPLPLSLPQPFDVQVTRPVTKDCLVSFENRQYSVPFIYTGKEVTVRGCQGTVQIYSDLKKIAQYSRHTECRLLIDQNHYEGKGTREIIAPTPLGRIGGEKFCKSGYFYLAIYKSIREWPEMLAGDEVLATAILDRLLHRCHVIQIDGHSFRLKEIEKKLTESIS